MSSLNFGYDSTKFTYTDTSNSTTDFEIPQWSGTDNPKFISSDNFETTPSFNGIYRRFSEIINGLFEYFSNFLNNDYFDKIYPVGSIYISVSNTLPESFEGTWVRKSGAILYAEAESNNSSLGSIYGDVNIDALGFPEHKHKLPDTYHRHAPKDADYFLTAGSESVDRTKIYAYTSDQGKTTKGYNVLTVGSSTSSNGDFERHKVTEYAGYQNTYTESTGEGTSGGVPYHLCVSVWQRTK